nr:hypothetical protein [Flavobacterium hiemivividum]
MKNIFYDVKSSTFSGAIKTVGLIIDESHFLERNSLMKELVENGILEENITIITYKNSVSKSGTTADFSSKDLKSNFEITNAAVNDFISQDFDVLISYYEVDRPILMLITHCSIAKLKVGFASIDKRLNHLIIDTTAEKNEVFTNELFKYLKRIKQN